MLLNYSTITPLEAIQEQQRLRELIRIQPLNKEITTIAGADISFNKYSEIVYAGIVVLSFPYLQVIDKSTVISRTTFPYIPGLLAFREVPALLEAWNNLTTKPDLLVLDGHGIAHPRRMGIAAHFGVVANHPTMGCAKSLLTGKYEEPAPAAFSQSPLISKDETIGIVLRTKAKTNPVYISPGHLITMDESVNIIKHCVTKYRIPEPTRLAHLLVNEVRIAHGEKPS